MTTFRWFQHLMVDRCSSVGRFFLACLCTTIAATVRAESVRMAESAEAGVARFLPGAFHGHVSFLAHDALKGRGTGSPGIDLAAGFIAGHFAAAGVLPGGPDGTYFQEFTIPGRAELKSSTRLSITGLDRQPILREDFLPFSFSEKGSFEGEVVFVGYGITNPEKDYDDYAGVDVTGKVLLMLRREPPGWNASGFSDHARFDRKIVLSREKGAAAVLIVNQAGETGSDRLMPFSAANSHGLPALHVRREVGDQMLKAAGLPDLVALQQKLDAGKQGVSAPLMEVRVSGEVAIESEVMVARNVIGVLPGSGPNRDEYILIGAHYDHLGERNGQIFNGADDNASGTSVVMELASALARTPDRNRSVVFMAFSAEEIGLIGSRYYVDHPTVPLTSITTMVNLDMVGRLNNDDVRNQLGVHGLGTGDVFHDLIREKTAAHGLNYVPDDSAMGPSDHQPFYQAGVPALFFFTGLHAEYHQPSDVTELVNYEGLAQVAGLAHDVVLDLMQSSRRPVYQKVNRPANIYRDSQGRGGGGVVMGIQPDPDDDPETPGWRVAMVLPDGGAAKAGMKDGDVIVRIDDMDIRGMADYRSATREKKAGDVITVTVLREGSETHLEVTLSGRGRR